MENGPFEDVFPIENEDIPACYVSLPEGNPNKSQTVFFEQPQRIFRFWTRPVRLDEAF